MENDNNETLSSASNTIFLRYGQSSELRLRLQQLRDLTVCTLFEPMNRSDMQNAQNVLIGIDKVMAHIKELRRAAIPHFKSYRDHEPHNPLLTPVEEIREFRLKMLSLNLPDNVFDLVQDTVQEYSDAFSLEMSSEEIQKYIIVNAKEAIAYCNTRMQGDRFLDELAIQCHFPANIGYKDVHKVTTLIESARVHEGDAADLIWLLYVISDCDIVTVDKIVTSALHAHSKNEDGTRQTFCQHLGFSLGVYADISQDVCEKCNTAVPRTVVDRTKRIFQSIFRDKRLCSMDHINNDNDVNLLALFNEHLRKSQHLIPWLFTYLDQTPYSSSKIGSLFSEDVPREVIAQVLCYLNDREYYSQLQELNTLANNLQSILDIKLDTDEDCVLDDNDDFQVSETPDREVATRDRRRVSNVQNQIAQEILDDLEIDHERRKAPIASNDPYLTNDAIEEVDHKARLKRLHRARNLGKRAYGPFVELAVSMGAVDPSQTLEGMLGQAHAFLSKQKQHPLQSYSVPKTGETFHPIHALVRLLDPYTIASDRSDGHKIQKMVQALFAEFAREQDDSTETLKNPWQKPDSSIDTDNRLLGPNAQMLARSIQLLLQDTDPKLDVPLHQFQSKGKRPLARSFREIVMELAKQTLHPDMIRYGPRYDPDAEEPRKTKGDPVFATPLRPDESMHQPMRYNMSAGTPRNRHTLRVADAILGHQSEPDWERAQRITQREMQRYLKATKYQFLFYPNGKMAFGELMRQWFPDAKKRHAIFGHQEYGLLTEYFGDGNDVIHTNTGKRSKTAEELFREIKRKAKKKNTLMALFSLDTRFGDALCSEGKGKPNDYYVAKFIKMLREDPATKNIILGLDIAQTIGRTAVPSLDRLGADYYVYSCTKGLKVPSVGGVALSEQFIERMTDGRRRRSEFIYGSSSMECRNIMALAVRLQLLSSQVNLLDVEANLERPVGRRYEQDVHENIRKLTCHAVARADRFGRDFMDRYLLNPLYNCIDGQDIRWHPQLICKTERELERDFGCEIIEPCHRNVIDFNNAITVQFPMMNGKRLRNHLSRSENIDIDAVHFMQRAVRLSWDEEHQYTIDDIDLLFDAMLDAQYCFLQRDVESNESKKSDTPIRCIHDIHQDP